MKLLLMPEDVTTLKRLRLSEKWGWPATFSCNQNREVWPCVTFGLHPPGDRYEVRGLPSLDAIVDGVLGYRPEGGRFHIDDTGVTLARNGRKIIELEYRPS